MVGQGEWAGVVRNALFRALRKQIELRVIADHAHHGEVWLVGAGPGDPELLTVKAARLLRAAEVVLYDNLVDAAILELIGPEAERIYVGKQRDRHPLPQEAISELMVEHARRGRKVLRLKGGDPFVFERGGEEIERLAEAGVPFEVVPGITAAIGCAAYAGIPLTHRDHAQSCVFVTAHGRDGLIDTEWAALIRPGQTVAIYMGLGKLEELFAAMLAAGLSGDLPAAIVDNGTRPDQRVVTGTIATLPERARAEGLKGPTIIIVGSVVTLRDRLDWNGARGA